MIEIRKIQSGDLETILESPLQDSVLKYPEFSVPEDSFAGVQDGELLGIGGVIDKGNGVGEAWVMLIKSIDRGGTSGIRAFHAIRKKLFELCEKFDRCDSLVREDYPKALAMIKALKFEYVETKEVLDTTMHLYSRKTK